MKVLCVAEKPSISKAVSRILSNDSAQTRPTDNKYIKNYCFRSRFQGQDCEVVMTALLGHLMEMDFPDHYRGWRSCAFQDLFDAPIRKAVRADMDALARNLRSEARHADVLFIWTDCDREGENIGWEVAEVCRTARPAIQVRRARFSVVQAPEVLRAWAQPVDLDLRQAMAVEARQELDLRVGAAFTRFQTLHLGAAFAEFQEAPQHAHGRAKSKLLSYGSCQFPTLGFVVYRYLEASRFVSETFWKIEMRLKSPAIGETASDTSDQTVSFAWQKGHVFDDAVAQALYARCFDARGQASARIIRVNSRPTTRRPPLPLTTVEMQRACSTKLRLASDRVMTLAEALYNQGFISYPRTETDEFEPTFPLRDLIGQQTSDPAFGPYAHFLLEDGGFQFPRRGQHNDKAHPPIHPVKSGHALQGDERRIFEFVTRRFLACCSKAAMGQETTVEAHVRDEVFTASGTMILDPAWYRVYPYERWTGRLLPTFRPGDVIVPDVFTIATGKTTAPRLLTEADLISLMDKSGIGTDATIHEHIKKLFERQYAAKEGAAITPTTLGIALIAGYDAMAIGVNLARPNLRAAMERTMVDICSGAKQREQVVRDAVRSYRDVFLQVLNQRVKLEEACSLYFGHGAAKETERTMLTPSAISARASIPVLVSASTPASASASASLSASLSASTLSDVGACPDCGGALHIKSFRPKPPDGASHDVASTSALKWMIGCSGYPSCRRSVFFPVGTTHVASRHPETCTTCGRARVRVTSDRAVAESCVICSIPSTASSGSSAADAGSRPSGGSRYDAACASRGQAASSYGAGGGPTRADRGRSRPVGIAHAGFVSARHVGTALGATAATASAFPDPAGGPEDPGAARLAEFRAMAAQALRPVESRKPRCQCRLVATRLVASERSGTGANAGRAFWRCGKQVSRCAYFEWEDAMADPPPPPSPSYSDRKLAPAAAAFDGEDSSILSTTRGGRASGSRNVRAPRARGRARARGRGNRGGGRTRGGAPGGGRNSSNYDDPPMRGATGAGPMLANGMHDPFAQTFDTRFDDLFDDAQDGGLHDDMIL